MKTTFYELEVGYVRREMDSTVEIGFNIPKERRDEFKFHPGQYLTLKVKVGSQMLRRAYSICSPINGKRVSVLVKRLEGGRVSNYLNDHINPQDRLSVMSPLGEFKIEGIDQIVGTYYFIGAGSGITPLMSMIQSILHNNDQSTCHLLYGNKDEENIIFKRLLSRLQLVYPERLTVTYVLSIANMRKTNGFWNSTNKKAWTGLTGRINTRIITNFLNENHGSDIKGYFICGPGKMIETSVGALHDLGIDKSLVHREYFTSADLQPIDEDPITGDEKLKTAYITYNGTVSTLSISPRANVIQAMEAASLDPPYSCLSGTCSTCKARVIKGEVDMKVDIGLEDGEAEQGYILTCQSYCKTDEVSLTYDIE